MSQSSGLAGQAGSISPALATPAVKANTRMLAIDALRGFALGGVLMVNLASFTLYEFLPDPARVRALLENPPQG